jgi:hypothetical protein
LGSCAHADGRENISTNAMVKSLFIGLWSLFNENGQPKLPERVEGIGKLRKTANMLKGENSTLLLFLLTESQISGITQSGYDITLGG